MELVKFEPKKDSREVISTLSELLERAKSGEFDCFVAVLVRSDGTFCTRSSGYKNSLEVLGALQCAQHDVIIATEK